MTLGPDNRVASETSSPVRDGTTLLRELGLLTSSSVNRVFDRAAAGFVTAGLVDAGTAGIPTTTLVASSARDVGRFMGPIIQNASSDNPLSRFGDAIYEAYAEGSPRRKPFIVRQLPYNINRNEQGEPVDWDELCVLVGVRGTGDYIEISHRTVVKGVPPVWGMVFEDAPRDWERKGSAIEAMQEILTAFPAHLSDSTVLLPLLQE